MNILEPMNLINDEVEKELLLQEGKENSSLEAAPRKKLFGKIRLPDIKPFPWKALNRKNLVLAGCIILLGVAGYLNFRFAGGTPENIVSGVENSPEAVSKVDGDDKEEDYFSAATLSRARARDEAVDVYKNISENASATKEEKENAIAQISLIADRTAAEINIENLVRAKGFEECIAVISESDCSVVVGQESLSAGQIAQIKEIVYLETSIHPNSIKIIENQ